MFDSYLAEVDGNYAAESRDVKGLALQLESMICHVAANSNGKTVEVSIIGRSYYGNRTILRTRKLTLPGGLTVSKGKQAYRSHQKQVSQILAGLT